MTRIWPFLLKIVVASLGLAPSLVVAYYLGPGSLTYIPKLFSTEFPIAMQVLLITGLGAYGIISLIRYLFGASLVTILVGLTAGTIAVAYLVMLPYVLMALEYFGYDELRTNFLLGISALLTPPMFVFLTLSILGWKARPSGHRSFDEDHEST